jgi:hypothetical protein
MSKLDKLLKKLLNDPPELDYDDVYYILISFGFQEISSKGSHHTFRNNKSLKLPYLKKEEKPSREFILNKL